MSDICSDKLDIGQNVIVARIYRRVLNTIHCFILAKKDPIWCSATIFHQQKGATIQLLQHQRGKKIVQYDWRYAARGLA